MTYLEQMYIRLLNLLELLLTILQCTNTTSVIPNYGTFSPFPFLVTLHLVLPSNFIVSGVKSSR